MKKYFLIFGWMAMSTFLQAQTLDVLQTNLPDSVPFAKPFDGKVLFSHAQNETVQLVKDSEPEDFPILNIKWDAVSPTQTQATLTLLPLTLDKSTFTASFALDLHPTATAQVQVPLTVTPVTLFKDKELKEIRPPHRLFNWALWACILLALISLVCWLIWWKRQLKDNPDLLTNPPDNRPAHVIALSQIDALVDSGLWENKQYKVFYITLTEILRTYLQKAFGLDVSADTSAELLRRIKTNAQLTHFIQSLRAFLSSGDLVKFAKAVPTEQTRNQDITILREFITQTAPKPQPQTPNVVEVKL